jgi:hypothetical protein
VVHGFLDPAHSRMRLFPLKVLQIIRRLSTEGSKIYSFESPLLPVSGQKTLTPLKSYCQFEKGVLVSKLTKELTSSVSG